MKIDKALMSIVSQEGRESGMRIEGFVSYRVCMTCSSYVSRLNGHQMGR